MSLRRRAFLISILPGALACGRRPSGMSTQEELWWPEQILTPAERRAEVVHKLGRVRAWLLAEKLDAVILSRPWNFAWVTGGAANTEAGEGGGPAARLIVGADGKVLVEAETAEAARLARQDLDGLGWEFDSRPWFEPATAPARGLQGRAFASDISCPGARPADGSLQDLQVPLLDSEVRKYRWLGRRASESVQDVCRRIEPGMTDRGMEALVASALLHHAITPVRIRVATDDRAVELAAPMPSELHKMERFVVIGVCAQRWGMHVALTRMLHLGPPSPELERKLRKASRLLAGCWARTVPGSTAGAVLQGLIADAIEEECPEAWKETNPGGATGYREHDWFALPGYPRPVRENQAFSWRAGIGGLRMQETILLAGETLDPITVTTGWPIVEAKALKRIYRLPAILVR